jgi:hypothetical protein
MVGMLLKSAMIYLSVANPVHFSLTRLVPYPTILLQTFYETLCLEVVSLPVRQAKSVSDYGQ